MSLAAYLDSIRRDIEMHRATIAELVAKGLEVRFYVEINTDDEFRMDRSFYCLGALSRRYGEVLTEMYAGASSEVARECEIWSWMAKNIREKIAECQPKERPALRLVEKEISHV